MLTLNQGKVLGTGDLNIIVRDATGMTFDPFSITYSIFSETNGSLVLVSQPSATPTKGDGVGLYYVSMTIPTTWPEGKYKLLWHVIQADGSNTTTVEEEFFLMTFRPEVGSIEAASVLIAKRLNVNLKTADAVMAVRELLSDTNPDRNYHFRPPTAGKVVAGFSTRVGFIWQDETILRLMKLTISQINYANPKNVYSYNLDNIPEDWVNIAALGTAAKCLSAEAARWTADEFGYSLNGVSLDIQKASQYQQLGEAYKTEFSESIVTLTANRPGSVGLRQSRFLLG